MVDAEPACEPLGSCTQTISSDRDRGGHARPRRDGGDGLAGRAECVHLVRAGGIERRTGFSGHGGTGGNKHLVPSFFW